MFIWTWIPSIWTSMYETVVDICFLTNNLLLNRNNPSNLCFTYTPCNNYRIATFSLSHVSYETWIFVHLAKYSPIVTEIKVESTHQTATRLQPIKRLYIGPWTTRERRNTHFKQGKLFLIEILSFPQATEKIGFIPIQIHIFRMLRYNADTHISSLGNLWSSCQEVTALTSLSR